MVVWTIWSSQFVPMNSGYLAFYHVLINLPSVIHRLQYQAYHHHVCVLPSEVDNLHVCPIEKHVTLHLCVCVIQLVMHYQLFALEGIFYINVCACTLCPYMNLLPMSHDGILYMHTCDRQPLAYCMHICFLTLVAYHCIAGKSLLTYYMQPCLIYVYTPCKFLSYAPSYY
jgi:hypothetical protein